MVLAYKKTPSYQKYLNINPATGRGMRLDNLMPIPQYNEHGELIIVPGEVYCRWRHDDGTSCRKETAFATFYALRRHYAAAHGSIAKLRLGGRITRTYEGSVHRWYHAIVNGEKPSWVPSEDDDASVAFELRYAS